MSTFENKIIDAVEILLNQRLATAKFTKTAQASIISCLDKEIGKYQCYYQGDNIIAYSSNPSITYANGSTVTILVQDNDLSKDKIIIGAVQRGSIVTPSAFYTDEEKYEVVGRNCIVKMTSPITFNDIITNFEDKEDIRENIANTIDNGDEIKEYITNTSYIKCGIEIDVDINSEDWDKANYQVDFVLNFAMGEESGTDITYTVGINDVIGQPYKTTSTQYVVFPVPNSSKFNKIKSIFAKAKGLGNESTVTIKNVELYAMRLVSSAELEGPSIKLATPNGYLLISDGNSVLVEPEFLNERAPIDEIMEYKWYSEDMSKTTKEDNDILSKPGWKEEEIGDLELEENDFTTSQAQYRCACEYKGVVVESFITIKKPEAEHSIKIEPGAEGIEFHKNYSGDTVITCKILDKQNQEIGDISDYSFFWAEYTQDGQFKQHNAYTVNQIKISIPSVTGSSTFKCTVKQGNSLIGTASLIITNSEKTGDAALVIDGAAMLFNYNAKGEYRPKTKKNEDGVLEEIPYHTLYFKLETEDKIFDSSAKDFNPQGMVYTWSWREKDLTLLEILSSTEKVKDENGEEKYPLVNGTSIKTPKLNYKLKDVYIDGLDNANNQIDLKVEYQGKTYLATTSFTINKAEPVISVGNLKVDEETDDLTATEKDADGNETVVSGVSGSAKDNTTEEDGIVYWTGGLKSNAKFAVYRTGDLKATSVAANKYKTNNGRDDVEGVSATIDYITDVSLDDLGNLIKTTSTLTFVNGLLVSVE